MNEPQFPLEGGSYQRLQNGDLVRIPDDWNDSDLTDEAPQSEAEQEL